MFQRLKQLLANLDTPAAGPRSHNFEERQLAAAALMVEAATLDADFDQTERQRIAALLQASFQLDADDARQLVELAQAKVADSVEWHGFTQAIKAGFGPEERVALIEMLWEVAYADGVLHDYEASLIRRINGLIYVSDRDSGEARKRVLARLQQG